ncbi:MAG: ATP-binding protein [Streptosporangiaceae bacterium]
MLEVAEGGADLVLLHALERVFPGSGRDAVDVAVVEVLQAGREPLVHAIASNEPFSAWTKTFTDPRLCAAIVDRLTFAGQIIETGTTSYRLAQSRKKRSAGS